MWASLVGRTKWFILMDDRNRFAPSRRGGHDGVENGVTKVNALSAWALGA